jgi:hypothetical protein
MRICSVPAVPTEDEDVNKTIATLLLTQAPSESAADFARIIPRATTEAIRAAGCSTVAPLLDLLEASEQPAVRTAACITAYEQLLEDGECIRRLESGHIAQEVGARIAKVRQRRNYLRQLATESLGHGARCPLALYAYGTDPADFASTSEYFSFLSMGHDSVFRACAEKELDRPAPVAK